MIVNVGISLSHCLFFGALCSFVNNLLNAKKHMLWTIPVSLIPVAIFAYFSPELIGMYIASVVIAMVIAEYMFSKYMSSVKQNGLAIVAPSVAIVLIYPLRLGMVQIETLRVLYITFFTTYIALLGFILVIAILWSQKKGVVGFAEVSSMLKGFTKNIIFVVVLALIGFLSAPQEINFAKEILFKQNILLPNQLIGSMYFVFMIALFLSTITYFGLMIYVILDEPLVAEKKTQDL